MSNERGPSRLINRNVSAPTGRTSIRLEPEIWDALHEICLREHVGLAEVIAQAESARQGGRTSAVRVYAFEYFRTATTEAGHLAAGHGRLDASNP